MRKVPEFTRYFVFIFVFAFSLSACKTARVITTTKLKPVNTAKLIKNIEGNALDYKFFSIKRINCQYQDVKGRTSFRATLKAMKDRAIVVSFNKLNIPVGRILLTPDSIKYINYVDKNYFVGDYGFLSNIFDVDIDFYDIQSILRNNIFSYRNDLKDDDFRNFTSYVDSGMYVLQSLKKRKLNKIEEKYRYQKVERILKRHDEESLILQTISVLPENFNVKNIKIEDKTTQQSLEFGFDDFTNLGNRIYPGAITMNIKSGQGKINMKLRLAGFSMDPVDNLNFTIPGRYKQLTFN